MGADFEFDRPRDCTHNPQKCPSGPADGNCADIAYTFGRAEILLVELRSAGVVLSIVDDGLAFDGPADAMTDDRLTRMRADRDGLLMLLERLEERAAIIEHDGQVDRTEAERLAWADVVLGVRPVELPVIMVERSAVVCPWCRSDRLADDALGVRCERCERLAWVLIDASLIRADAIDDGVEWIGPDDVDACPRCNDLCDTMTVLGRWVCSRCEPQRMHTTGRWLAYRNRIACFF